MNDPQEINLTIRCQHLPGTVFGEHAAVRLGIQKGTEVVEDEPAEGEERVFTVPFRVKRNPRTGDPSFSGPFVQGKSGDPFIYLCWGERQGTTWEGFRRAKLLLKDLDWPALEAAAKVQHSLEVTVDMRDSKGAPLAASIKPENLEWKLPGGS